MKYWPWPALGTARPWVRLAASIGGAEQHPIRCLVGERDQIRDVAHRHVLVDRQGDWLLTHHADRNESGLQIHRHFAFLLDRQDGECRGLRHVQAVPVLLDCRCRLGGNQPAGARSVEHDDLLLPNLGQTIGDDARHHVRAVAGGSGRDERDGFGGVVLRTCRRARRHHDGRNPTNAESQASHPH
jgi:hypothetical protein